MPRHSMTPAEIEFITNTLLSVKHKDLQILLARTLNSWHSWDDSLSDNFISQIILSCPIESMDGVGALHGNTISRILNEPNLGLEKTIKILNGIYDRQRNDSSYLSQIEIIGFKILRSKSFKKIQPALRCLDTSWAIVGNRHTPKDVALNLFKQTKEAYKKKQIWPCFVALLAIYGSSRFPKEAIDIAHEDSAISSCIFSLHMYPAGEWEEWIDKKIKNLSLETIRGFWTPAAVHFVVRCLKAPPDILEASWQTLQEDKYCWRYFDHLSCTANLSKMIWERIKDHLKATDYSSILRCKQLHKDVVTDILNLSDLRFLKKYKLKFSKFLGEDVVTRYVNGYLAAAKLKA